MKFYGHANLQQNELQNAVLSTLTNFPAEPKQGQIAFVNSTVFVCVLAGALPVWVPLTREITAYTHVQDSPSQTWAVTHNLNTTSVSIQVYDETGFAMIANTMIPTSPNTATLTFSTAQGGRAVIVSGHFDGNAKPTYAHTHYQQVSATSWVINHNLGYNPIVRIFIGNAEVQPASIVHNTTNQTTVTFNTAQVGYARLI